MRVLWRQGWEGVGDTAVGERMLHVGQLCHTCICPSSARCVMLRRIVHCVVAIAFDIAALRGVMLRKSVALIADIGKSGVEGVSQRRRRFFGSGVLAFHDFN